MTPAFTLTHRAQTSVAGEVARAAHAVRPARERDEAAPGAGGRPRSQLRDGILYANAEAALVAAGAIEMTMPNAMPATRPGFIRIGSDERVLAIGLDAHLALADWQKCTFIAEALDLATIGSPGEAGRSHSDMLNDLLWSCLNTRRAVILGRRAWSAAQLLPFADMRFHSTPPLRWIESGSVLDRNKILIIDHEGTGVLVDEMQAALASYARIEVMRGWTLDAGHAAGTARLDAGTHLHIGEHGLSDDTVRLVDSWINRIPALHVRPRRGLQHRLRGEDTLSVRHGRDGFECSGIAEVLAAYEDLRGDSALRRKVTEDGVRAAAQLYEGWKAIATDLLDG